MANEITIKPSLVLKNQSASTSSPDKLTFSPGTLQFDQTALGRSDQILSIGTSEEDIALNDIGTLGWCVMHNLDAANYVTYGAKDTTMKAFGRIEAGEVAGPFRLEPGITIRAIANTAPVKVRVIVLED
jgi:hypothetical protein